MSDYDDGPRRYRSSRTRARERGDPEYVQETTYVERGKGPPPKDLVYRRRDDSVETIQRDFPPPGADRYRRDDRYRDDRYRDDRYYDDRPPRRARSAGGHRSRYDDDRYSDYEVPAAAGVAGYAAGRARERDHHRRRRHSSDSDSPSPVRSKKDDRRKSGVGEVLEGLGLGGIAGAILGKDKAKKDRSQSRDRGGRDRDRRDSGRSRRRDGSSSSRDGKKKGQKTERKWAQAAQAALVAGAVEAFRSRKEPGPWTGAKGRRVATAALGAGGIDGLVDRDPDKKSKRHLAEAVIGGLAANRIANGPRDRGRSADPSGRARSRSRSIFGGRDQSRGREKEGGSGGADALKGLAAGGALAAAGKAIYDRVRSKSRNRRRSPSTSSTDSYEPPSRNRRPRGGPRDDTRSRTSDTTNGDRARGNPGTNVVPAAGVGAGAGALAAPPGKGTGARTRSDSIGSASSSSLEDVEKKRRHMRGKELITAGLATVATIHAAHGVYSSMEAHQKRHKLVQEGEMSPEEARKKQTKAWVQDAAAVGIAALGIKGAFSEWKEMNEHRHEIHELAARKREKAKRKEKRERMRQQQFQMQQLQMMQPMMMQAMAQQQNGMQQQPQGGGYYRDDGFPPPPPGPPPAHRY